MPSLMRWPVLLFTCAVTLALQGCGVISYSRAGYLDSQRVKSLHRDCQKPVNELVCDHEMVIVTPPPVQMDRAQVQSAEAATAPATKAIADIRSARSSFELARTLLPMAYLSNVVYHRHETGAGENLRNAPEACVRGRPDSKHPLELKSDGSSGGWMRWDNVAGCAVDAGMFYDTYVREPQVGEASTHAVLVAIVFRGTENSSLQLGHDWTDNFLSAMGISPQQYLTAIERLKLTMAALADLKTSREDKGQRVEIYAAGHSLGGGLAQQAGYLYKEIKAVFAFNSSPVTNWTQLYLWENARYIQNHDPILFRVEQQGEFLDYLRFVTTRANSRMLGRTDIEFNFGSPGAVSGHSIAALSCQLAVRAAESTAEAAGPLGYTGDDAWTLIGLLHIKGMGCEPETLEAICEKGSLIPRACGVKARAHAGANG